MKNEAAVKAPIPYSDPEKPAIPNPGIGIFKSDHKTNLNNYK